MVSKFIERGANKENMWEHRAILEGNKDPPWETLIFSFHSVVLLVIIIQLVAV